jgi:hypothetical protein
VAAPLAIGEYVKADAPNAESYIVKDIRGLEAGAWRWAGKDPELRFMLAPAAPLPKRFRIELGINDKTFADTGPVKLILEVNGKEIGRATLDRFGDHVVEKAVPANLLHSGAENRAVIHVLNPWQAPDPGVRLGFVLKSAGFVR